MMFYTKELSSDTKAAAFNDKGPESHPKRNFGQKKMKYECADFKIDTVEKATKAITE